jgi:outer membrane protein assembly factor BamE
MLPRRGVELVHYKSIRVKGMIKRTVTMGMLTCAGLFLTGCSNWSWYSIPGASYLRPYTLDIQQGVIIDSDMVARLKEGMTRPQVAYTLGTPLLKDPFHKDRWDYVYFVREDGRLSHPHDLTVYFNDDKMVRYVTDYPIGGAVTSGTPQAVPVTGEAPVAPAATSETPAVPPAGSAPVTQEVTPPNPDGSAGPATGVTKGGMIDAGKTGE